MMKIVFASSNAGKINECQTLLRETNFVLIPQAELNIHDAEETGITFVENALIKARHAAKISGLPAIGDDSGICVPSLLGAPGIYSARYAGLNATAKDNIQKLLTELTHAEDEQRQAYFYTVMVYLAHAEDPTPLIAEGHWQGEILTEPSGAAGFGYDPIFYDKDRKMSAAALSLEMKNQISHRGQALRLLVEKLCGRSMLTN